MKILKTLFLMLMVSAMILSTVSVFASADKATITVTEVDCTDEVDEGVKKYVFNGKTPAGANPITVNGVVFTYDPNVIQPVRFSNGSNVDLVGGSDSVKARAFVPYEDDDYGYGFAPWKVETLSDGRVGVSVATTWTPDESGEYPGVDATNGMDFLQFYFKVKDGATQDADSIKLADASLLAEWYEPASITIGDYAYGVASGDDTATLAAFPYATAAKTQIDVSDVTFADFTKDYDGTAVEIAPANLPAGVTAKVTYSANPVDAGEYTATAELVLADAENTELVGAENADLTATIVINTVKVAIDVITIEGETTVQIPAELELTLANVPETVTATIEYKVGEEWVTTVPTEAGTYDVRVNVVAKDAKNYELTGEAATTTATILEADPVKEDLAVVTGVKELVINGKTYKDLYKVDVAISEGFVGKKITKYGVIFKDATEGATKGGAKIEVTPDTVIQIAEGGKFEFSAAVIGIPDTVTAVTATPFVWSK